MLAFADASRIDEQGQIGVIIGLLVDNMDRDAIFHPIFWMSHKAKRPVKSVPAAEILAASEAIDEGKIITIAFKEILSIEIEFDICVDSKDLFTSLSTQRKFY